MMHIILAHHVGSSFLRIIECTQIQQPSDLKEQTEFAVGIETYIGLSPQKGMMEDTHENLVITNYVAL